MAVLKTKESRNTFANTAVVLIGVVVGFLNFQGVTSFGEFATRFIGAALILLVVSFVLTKWADAGE